LERRLAAILAADVAGYTALMGADEAGTLRRLTDLRREFLEPLIDEHHGRVVKLIGDGLLVEFASVVDAVACALAWQGGVAERQAAAEDDKRLRFRVGINLGDVIVEGGDIYGDGVNIAARLEGLTKPDGICLSEDAYRQARGKLEAEFEDLGEQELKNVAERVRVYRVAGYGAATTTAAPARESLAPPDKPSIAVLPFTNMSGDPEQEYFSDGITEDIITELSRFKELSVVSRNSSFVFKGQPASLRDIGERLQADYIVEGSIRKAGNKVRVAAQLIDAKSDNHIWAERYDRDLQDIFEVQDDVVRRVSSTLVGRLEHERQERARRQSQSQLRAYDLYLRGREHYFNWSKDENAKARNLLAAATEIEPDYAAALALSSEVLLRLFLNGWSDNPKHDLEASFQAAKRANEIDDQDSRVQTALGMAYIWQQQLEKAKHHFERALKLNPNDTRALAYYSRQALLDGQTDRAIAFCHRAMELNPYGKYNYNIGIVYFVARNYRQAIEFLGSISNPPATALALLAASHAMAGDPAKAAETYARFTEAAKLCPEIASLDRPKDWKDFFAVRWPFSNTEDLDHLLRALGKAGLPVGS